MSGAECAKRWRSKNAPAVKAYQRSARGKYVQLKRAAKRNGLAFDITFRQYELYMVGFPCFYCGGPLAEYGYGLDRRDHLKGYTLENCVGCCGVKDGSRHRSCNFRKGHLEAAGFKFPRTEQLLREILEEERGK